LTQAAIATIVLNEQSLFPDADSHVQGSAIRSALGAAVVPTPLCVKNIDSLIGEGKIHKLPLSSTPLTEGAIRPIASSGLTDDQKREAWQKAFESGKPITKKSVKKVGFFGNNDRIYFLPLVAS
jgi:hypothetical protein